YESQKGLGAVSTHVTEYGRYAAVAQEVGDMVGGLRGAGPEVPLHVRRAQAVVQALLGANEVRELHAVADEEHRGVVAHDVVVTLLGVELQAEATHVAHGIREAELAGDRGEAGEHRGDRKS